MTHLNDVLTVWYERIVVTQRAHYLSADHFGRKSFWLGIPVIALSTIVGTSVFATLQQKTPDPRIQIPIGLASVTAAVLASLQTFLGYSERAEKHRVAGGKYGALGRELEVLRASPQLANQETIADLQRRMESLALESPNNPVWIYRFAQPKIYEPLRDKRANV